MLVKRFWFIFYELSRTPRRLKNKKRLRRANKLIRVQNIQIVRFCGLE